MKFLWQLSPCLFALPLLGVLGSEVSVTAQGQGKYVTQASARLTKLVNKANNEGYEFFNDYFSVGGAWLKQGKTNWVGLVRMPLKQGDTYRFLAAGDNDARDVDLQILDGNGRIMASDASSASEASVNFSPKFSQNYEIRLRLYNSQNNLPSLCIAMVMVKKAPVVVTKARPNNNLNPTYGKVDLDAGFLPDPYVKKLTAGGSLETNLGGVNAHVAKAPDFQLNYKKGGFPLNFHVKANEDTTLLINLPNGKWIANDDGGGFPNPLIELANPMSGRYDVYVGTVAKNAAPATLYITELKVK